jgi:succinate dehydrogenase/fumarate reductase flavoprotein subunit
MLLTSEIMTHAALIREESRGGHFRKDFPRIDSSKWDKSILIKQINGQIETSLVKL